MVTATMASHPPLRMLETTDAVIEALGVERIRELTGRKSASAVFNWKENGFVGKFPADTFVVLTEALEREGFTAPPALWGMVPSHAAE